LTGVRDMEDWLIVTIVAVCFIVTVIAQNKRNR
jgi:hypothetical protein